MEERKLNEKESLALISQMIQNTQNKLTKNEGMPFLVWGYTTIVVTLAIWILQRIMPNYYWNLLWFLIPAAGWPLMSLFKKHQEKGVRTFVDKVIGYIWTIIGIGCLAISLLCMLLPMFQLPTQLNPLFQVLMLLGIGTALSGCVIKFRALTVGGILGLALAVVLLLLPGQTYSLLVFLLAFIVILIIPGHILNAKAKKYV